jgi:hypothetical protein
VPRNTTQEEEAAPAPNDVPEDGKKKKEREEEYDEEIFDDSDFYHQLLRGAWHAPTQLSSAQLSLFFFFFSSSLVCPELVESGTANVTDPIALGRSHAQLRRMLRKNKKKDVDQKVRNVLMSAQVSQRCSQPETNTTHTRTTAGVQGQEAAIRRDGAAGELHAGHHHDPAGDAHGRGALLPPLLLLRVLFSLCFLLVIKIELLIQEFEQWLPF